MFSKKKLNHLDFELFGLFSEQLSKELTGFFEANWKTILLIVFFIIVIIFIGFRFVNFRIIMNRLHTLHSPDFFVFHDNLHQTRFLNRLCHLKFNNLMVYEIKLRLSSLRINLNNSINSCIHLIMIFSLH